MALQHCGIALFVLVYVYVYFKHAREIRAVAEAEVQQSSAWKLITRMGMCAVEVLCAEILVFLALLLLTLTCFRALSQLSLGVPVDGFTLKIAFEWVANRRVFMALAAGTILSVVAVSALVFLSKLALQNPQRPEKPKRFDLVQSYILHPLRLLLYYCRRVFLPYGVPANTVRDVLVHGALVVNLLVQAMCIVLAYADLSLAEGLLSKAAAGIVGAAFTDAYVPQKNSV